MDTNIRLLQRINSHFVPFNAAAVFSDETLNFVSDDSPEPGEAVTITLRTARDNCSAAFLHIEGAETFSMEKVRSCALFDYYAAGITAAPGLRYHFSLEYDGKTYYYNKRGLFPDIDRH